MFASLFAFVILAATTASPQPAPAQAAQPGPLREVAYKVSVGMKSYSGGEHFEGFSSSSRSSTDTGTVTVDINAVQNDVLGVSVTELLNQTGHPATFSGSVMPDGAVNFPPQTIQEVTRQLLHFFGAQLIPPDKLVQGATWQTSVNREGVDVETTYKVTKIDGPLLTLSERQTLKIASQNVTIATEGTVTMKPELLVPVNGDLRTTVSRVTAEGDTKTETSMRFDRVSDSRDQPAK
jgi:hypothetical protein